MNPLLIDYFVNNHEHLKGLLQSHCDKYNHLMTEEDPILRNDIDREFSYVVKSVLINEASKALALSTEECIIVVESIDIKEFFEVKIILGISIILNIVGSPIVVERLIFNNCLNNITVLTEETFYHCTNKSAVFRSMFRNLVGE